MCEAYIIPFLFGSFFTVCHPYIDVHFLKCFLCDFRNKASEVAMFLNNNSRGRAFVLTLWIHETRADAYGANCFPKSASHKNNSLE